MNRLNLYSNAPEPERTDIISVPKDEVDALMAEIKEIDPNAILVHELITFDQVDQCEKVFCEHVQHGQYETEDAMLRLVQSWDLQVPAAVVGGIASLMVMVQLHKYVENMGNN